MSGGRKSWLKCPSCGKRKGVEEAYLVGMDREGEGGWFIRARACRACGSRWTPDGRIVYQREPRIRYGETSEATEAAVAGILEEADRLDAAIKRKLEDVERMRVFAKRLSDGQPLE